VRPVILDVPGYGDRVLSCLLLEQEETSGHLGLLFPGRAYNCSMPAMYYAATLLNDLRADVLHVEHDYLTNADLPELGSEEFAACLLADARGAWEAASARRAYERVTLVGKSLGTWALALLANHVELPRRTEAVWLTPLLKHPPFVDLVTRWGGRSLFVVGTADPHYGDDEGSLDAVTAGTEATTLVVPDADHALEVPGDLSASLAALTDVMESVAAFVE
jgi:hypothetical protein